MKPTIFKADTEKKLTYQAILDSLQLDNVNISGKYILLTGATKGIGLTIAVAAAKSGATIILMDKSIPALESVYNDIMAIDGVTEPFLLPVDLAGATLDDYIKIAETLSENIPQLDGIIHNAAQFDGLFSILQTPPDTLLAQIQVNLTAPIWITQSMFALLKKSERPTLLFADHCETTGDNDAYWNSYAVAKTGLMKFMQQLSYEYADSYNLHSYGYNTGWVNTELSRNAYPNAKPEWSAAYDANNACKILSLFNCDEQNGTILNLSK